MKDLGYFIMKVKYKLSGGKKEVINDYFRKSGMKIGKNCAINCNIMTPEPYLIEIGDGTTVAADVTFVTHDNSISKVIPDVTDLFGKICIGSKCFIGSRSVLMYGVTLAEKTIVAAGSVVTKSFLQPGTIIGGNPAKVIGTWEKFAEKSEKSSLNVDGLSFEEKRKVVCENLVSR